MDMQRCFFTQESHHTRMEIAVVTPAHLVCCNSSANLSWRVSTRCSDQRVGQRDLKRELPFSTKAYNHATVALAVLLFLAVILKPVCAVVFPQEQSWCASSAGYRFSTRSSGGCSSCSCSRDVGDPASLQYFSRRVRCATATFNVSPGGANTFFVQGGSHDVFFTGSGKPDIFQGARQEAPHSEVNCGFELVLIIQSFAPHVCVSSLFIPTKGIALFIPTLCQHFSQRRLCNLLRGN